MTDVRPLRLPDDLADEEVKAVDESFNEPPDVRGEDADLAGFGRMTEPVRQLRDWMKERLSRFRDALDREAFLGEAHALMNRMWDHREEYDARSF